MGRSFGERAGLASGGASFAGHTAKTVRLAQRVIEAVRFRAGTVMRLTASFTQLIAVATVPRASLIFQRYCVEAARAPFAQCRRGFRKSRTRSIAFAADRPRAVPLL